MLCESPGLCNSTPTNAFRRVKGLCVCVCVDGFRFVFACLSFWGWGGGGGGGGVFIYLFIITLPHGQRHAVFGGFIFISAGWMLLCKEIIMAEYSAHITMQRVTASGNILTVCIHSLILNQNIRARYKTAGLVLSVPILVQWKG